MTLTYAVWSINQKIFNYLDTWQAAFSIEISDIKNSRPQDGAAASLWQATTLELSRTNHNSFDTIGVPEQKCRLPFAENRNSVQKTCVQNTILKASLWSMWIYVGGYLAADCFFASKNSKMLASKAPVVWSGVWRSCMVYVYYINVFTNK